jgi:serine protease Do
MAKQAKLSQPIGAMIDEVTPGSPGQRAGLKPGDIVIELDGKKVTDSRQLQLMIAEKPPGSKVTIKIVRDGREQTVTVQLGESPTQLASQPGDSNDQQDSD